MRFEDRPEGLSIELDSEDDTDRLGRAIAGASGPDTVIGLVGPLGAGKTRLTRSIAGALGVDPDAVSSPTFVLIHEYEGRLPVFHFDAYRLGGPEPFEALGAEEYWTSGGVCVVEWADLVPGLLPAETLWVSLELTGGTARRARIIGPGAAAVGRLLRGAGGQI